MYLLFNDVSLNCWQFPSRVPAKLPTSTRMASHSHPQPSFVEFAENLKTIQRNHSDSDITSVLTSWPVWQGPASYGTQHHQLSRTDATCQRGWKGRVACSTCSRPFKTIQDKIRQVNLDHLSMLRDFRWFKSSNVLPNVLHE